MWEFPGWKSCFGLRGLIRGIAERLSPGGQGGGRMCPYCGRSLQQEILFLLQPQIRRVENVTLISPAPLAFTI